VLSKTENLLHWTGPLRDRHSESLVDHGRNLGGLKVIQSKQREAFQEKDLQKKSPPHKRKHKNIFYFFSISMYMTLYIYTK